MDLINVGLASGKLYGRFKGRGIHVFNDFLEKFGGKAGILIEQDSGHRKQGKGEHGVYCLFEESLLYP